MIFADNSENRTILEESCENNMIFLKTVNTI
ncbi:hypothetical protein T06_1215 [Trichinella sp. T6]|nr:hypothetical protein T06_1215 [Trichinella sp. T6]